MILENFITIVAIGVLASKADKRALWSIAFIFILMVSIGLLFNYYNIHASYTNISLSLCMAIIGLLIVFDKILFTWMITLSMGYFAFLYGNIQALDKTGSTLLFFAFTFVMLSLGYFLLGVLMSSLLKKLVKGKLMLSHFGSALLGVGLYISYYRLF